MHEYHEVSKINQYEEKKYNIGVLNWLASAFQPPFLALPYLCWVYVIYSYLVYPRSYILAGNLIDPDDYMYLAQIQDWLNGQGWFDSMQYRMNPPNGVPIHFSRIFQLPIALTAQLFGLFFDPHTALFVAAAILPPLLLLFFFRALPWCVTPLVPARWARFIAFLTLFSGTLLFQFAPGHVDHHGANIFLMALALGFLARAVLDPPAFKNAAAAGFCLGLSLVIALEVLPWLLLFAAWFGLWAVVTGKPAARNALAFALALWATGVAGLLLSVAPQHWLEANLVAFSSVYVALIGLIGLCFVCAAAFAARPLPIRLGAVGAFVMVGGFCFLNAFPALRQGPYGAVDPELTAQFFKYISEARPGYLLADGDMWQIIITLFMPVIAVLAAIYFAFTAKETGRRWIWCVIFTGESAAILLYTFYQARFNGSMALFCLFPLTALFAALWQTLDARRPGILTVPKLTLLACIAPLPLVFIPAAYNHARVDTGLLLFPAAAGASSCNSTGLVHMLNLEVYYGKRPLVIMNDIDMGPELLFKTKHKIIGALYHTNVAGYRDGMQFFTTQDPEIAHKIAKAHKVDLVVFCKNLSDMYTTETNEHQAFLGDVPKPAPLKSTFAEQLVKGDTPLWLKPIHEALLGGYMLFEVLPNK